jgi:transketolase
MTGATSEIMNIDPLDKKLESFGWDVHQHPGRQRYPPVSCEAFENSRPWRSPKREGRFALLANTIKGKGVDFMKATTSGTAAVLPRSSSSRALASLEKSKKETK